MFVKSIELDGFKSYARKEKIDGFDEQFNAITGLNGSGKSNILDSICFVLGITKLDAIRAKNLTDLIFKQGQAGITKATVSITFDNSDKKQSPIGYAHCNEIVVKRQVQVGGKSTYQVNGITQSNSKVIDLFRSVSLNVNNPHFLIMQGRITKVLNMKPIEILGMIEEAAGTKLYEQRKDEALRTIRNKDIQMKEINEMLDGEIDKQLEKMRGEKQFYARHVTLKKQLAEALQKREAFRYWDCKTRAGKYEEETTSLDEEIKGLEAELNTCEEALEKFKTTITELETEKSRDNGMSAMEAKQRALAKELGEAESVRDGVIDQQKKDKIEIDRITKTIDADKKVLDKKEKELEKIKKDNEKDIDSTAEDEKKVVEINKQLDALAQGMTTDEKGNAITFEKKIQDFNTELNEHKIKITQDHKRVDLVKKNLKEAEREFASIGHQSSRDADDEKNKKKEMDQIQAEITRVDFDSNRDAQLTAEMHQKRTELNNVSRDIDQIRQDTAQTYGNLFFKYHTNDPRFDHSDVIGPLATLIKVKDPKWNYAVQIAGGGNLWDVVVRKQAAAVFLAETKGVTHQRRTYVPIAETRCEVQDVPNQTRQGLQKMARDKQEQIVMALDVLEYPPELGDIVKNVCRNQVLCESIDTMTEITNKFQLTAVSMDGAVSKTGGHLSGGHDSRTPLFNLLGNFKELIEQETKLNEEVNRIDAELRANSGMKAKFADLQRKLRVIEMELKAIEERKKNSRPAQLQTDIDGYKQELEELTKEILELTPKVAELEAKITDAQKQQKNLKAYQADQKKKLQSERKACEDRMKANKDKTDKLKRDLANKEQEIIALKDQITKEKEEVQQLADGIEARKASVLTEEKKVADKKATMDEVDREVMELRVQMKRTDEKLKKVQKEADSKKKEINEMKSTLSDKTKKLTRITEDAEKYKKEAEKLYKKNEKLFDDIKDLLGQKGSIYDFDGYTDKAAETKINELQEEMKEVEKKFNKNVINILDTAEQRALELRRMRDQVVQDRSKMLEIIETLDKKKDEEVLRAYESVNKDFGNIYSTLLPGTAAKLEPPAGHSALDGLEVKVAFNGVWKESLQELSGGQRSLVALSLVLAMLKFRPAPIYILDEVDAALDVSHTTNIGKMIKKYFTNSQFIIVSLKEGMFNNANVLFKTRFQDGTSQVTRHFNRNQD